MVAPSIEGAYQLVRRELPDGTVQLPPAVKGMITYTREFQNFGVVWKDDKGRRSPSHRAELKATGKDLFDDWEKVS